MAKRRIGGKSHTSKSPEFKKTQGNVYLLGLSKQLYYIVAHNYFAKLTNTEQYDQELLELN